MIAAPSLFLNGCAAADGTPIFAQLALDVPAGGWTCLLGPSGVGKSTILKLFSGLETGVAFTGTLGADDGAPLAGRIALMAQDDLLMPWLSVLGNVTLGGRLRAEAPDHARASAVLEQVGLAGMGTRKPAELSGGQRQRVALARTLMENRPIVLLDEPFSALDARTRAQMQELTARLLQGRTVLLVTHDPAEAARLGQKIVILSEDGLRDIPPPSGTVPRPVNDPDLLAAQARLLTLLRGDAP